MAVAARRHGLIEHLVGDLSRLEWRTDGPIVGQRHRRGDRHQDAEVIGRSIEFRRAGEASWAEGLDLFPLDNFLERLVDQVVGGFFDQCLAAKIVFENKTRCFAFAEAGYIDFLRKLTRSPIQPFFDLIALKLDIQRQNALG